MDEVQKKQVTYDAISSFIIAIKCFNMDEIKQHLAEFQSIIVNRLQTQTRQPSLYFAATLSDHQQSYQIMKLLLQHGANPHFTDNYQQTVLFYVCKDGKEKCLDLLLENGLLLDDEDLYGQTPIFYAAKQNRMNIIHRLIERKINLNQIDKIAGQTALFYGAKEGNLDMCKVLVESGCDLSIQDSSGKMASHMARKHNKQEVFDYLTAQFQILKDQKKIMMEGQSIQNAEKSGKNHKKKKDIQITQQTATYRLFRSDNIGNANEITSEEFQELLTLHSPLRAMFQNPDEIDMSQLQQIKAKDAWVKAAMRVLTSCCKSKGGYYFHEPVDPAKYGIDDYFDIITEPMDFGTIRKKLTHNVYSDINEFIRDVNLIFSNCVKYNGPQNLISKYALQIKNSFQENMKQMGYMN